jgi:hypothetical protein
MDEVGGVAAALYQCSHLPCLLGKLEAKGQPRSRTENPQTVGAYHTDAGFQSQFADFGFNLFTFGAACFARPAG